MPNLPITCSPISALRFHGRTSTVSLVLADSSPRLLWSANRNYQVSRFATLTFNAREGLVLNDRDGTQVWSTNTAGDSVIGINLTETGNLVLFDGRNRTVWQSFDHPTDTLLVGQKLISGQTLTDRAFYTLKNQTWSWNGGGLYSLSVTNEGFNSIVGTDPPQSYFEYTYPMHSKESYAPKESTEPNYAVLSNGRFSLFVPRIDENQSNWGIRVPQVQFMQFVKLDYDGHLRVYDWVESQWQAVADVLTPSIGECGYPLVCGRYSICSSNGARVNCSCPNVATSKTNYFTMNDTDLYPKPGCYEATPLSCNASKYHELIAQKNVTFSNFGGKRVDINNTDMESCKQACLSNCSCRAALFYSSGECYLPSKIISLKDSGEGPSLFLKVQINPTVLAPTPEVPHTPVVPRRGGKTISRSVIILVSSIGALFGLCVIIFICVCLPRKERGIDEIEEDDLDQVPGMPMRFTYEELKVTTENFKTKLGQGGYGSVFEGNLIRNGTKVAVKHLDGLGHVKKSFLAEVKTIGSIHHHNLVRLVGYCAEKSHRLLVYEYMCNGSLEKWIFNSNQEVPLTWKNRRKIVLDIAKGLAYLHEDCLQKIVHLDIKPQNILLDDNFNAKVSDFGLSKLIDRDQTEVVTTMKGTPGYMAPEWLSSIITEKVDVYSFGVVVLEIICGRKNLDRSQPEGDMHLLALFRRKAEEDNLLNMVDKSGDMQLHEAEVVEMMMLAAWCLQSDFTKRPSMSMVVKAMEGLVEIERNLDYNFWIPPVQRTAEIVGHEEGDVGATSPMLASALSGPR
ncbi:G-type lectin S-receptor-like serine/threonine-protein kinase SD2-5 isoform X2 [Actinidia eriantha]|uniref:G-type lectin S-receptor-like serine/threonine-protein kinase SD2-5 isoform X2 n=1 Tax=Actinidia eriantha TaxID=165200 RepID=UPI002590A9B9|nr:G-type lectin S-receptor-like serine/threonine-protein kinase SD2-5 isoform X2 [Actinidia eriantha]